MTAPALSAAQEGTRYQYRFFWRMALPMLYLRTPPHVEKVVMEHRGVDAVDDVVVYWSAPGLSDGGKFVRIDYYQIKFHVALGRCVSAENLIQPGWTGTKHSLLWAFAASWKSLRQKQPDIRLTLVTNWAWCASDPIGQLIRDSGKLHESFFTVGSGSAVRRTRDAWRAHLSLLTDDEFNEFVDSLRLCVQAVSQSEAGQWLADRCQLAGLQPPDLTTNHSPYDDLAGRLLADGRREFTREELERVVNEEKLNAGPVLPFQSTCAIRSFRRYAHEPRTDAALVIDVTSMFEGRRLIDPKGWPAIRAKLDDQLRAVESLPTPVQVALDTHLSIGWYAGFVLNSKAGIPILLRQKSYGGVVLWETTGTNRITSDSWLVSTESVGEGPELAVAISVTHDVSADVRSQIMALAPKVGSIVNLRVPELGPGSIQSGGHACRLADDLVRTVRELAHGDRGRRTHVFAACPVSFAFLLGQRSAAIGPITIYEYDFGGSGNYARAVAT